MITQLIHNPGKWRHWNILILEALILKYRNLIRQDAETAIDHKTETKPKTPNKAPSLNCKNFVEWSLETILTPHSQGKQQ